MSNMISFIIRAIDLTKAGVNSAKRELKGLAKAFGGGNIVGMLGRGAIAGALVLSARAVGRWAEEIRDAAEGAFDSFATSGARSINAVTARLSNFWKAFKGEVVGTLGAKVENLFGLDPNAEASDADVARVKSEEDAKLAQIARIRKLQEETMMVDELLKLREDELHVQEAILAKNKQDRDALEEKLKIEKAIRDLKEKQAKIDEDNSKAEQPIADKARELAVGGSAAIRKFKREARAADREQDRIEILQFRAREKLRENERFGRGENAPFGRVRRSLTEREKLALLAEEEKGFGQTKAEQELVLIRKALEKAIGMK